MNKIRMVLLRNHLESQAGSGTFEKEDPASGLDGFATITAILFNYITISPEISWQLKVICITIHRFFPEVCSRLPARSIRMR